MTNVTIQATDGGQFSAYVATPAGDGKVPGMLVIQEIFGINKTVRDICDDYASRGYLAVAPDLFWRQEPGIDLISEKPDDFAKGIQLYQGFSETKGAEDLIATLAWLREQPRLNGKAGAVGYCLGGKLAFLMATRSDADAVVSYYGVGIDNNLAEAAAITKPFMLHIAEQDGFVPAEAQAKVKAGLAAITHATVYSYPGVDHAFCRNGGDHFEPKSAALANERTAEFFEHNLKKQV